MWVDVFDMFDVLEANRRMVREEKIKLDKTRAYICGVKQGFTKRYKENIYKEYQDIYNDGIIVGLGMNLWQYIKFCFSMRKIGT